MKRTIVILIVLFICISTLTAKTTRDLPPPPFYNPDNIKKTIILFLNLERVNSGKPALVINRNINTAARWHSDYMSEVHNLYHVSNRKGMHDVNQRVTRYTERIGLCAEIIGFASSLNLWAQSYTEKSDSEGTYFDFGDANIYWQNETEIAMEFIKKTVNNSKDASYKSYLENDIFNSIGGGITPGKFNSIDGWYGSFALVQKTDIHRAICKMNFRREILTKKVDGKETEEIIIKYNISGFNRDKVSILAVTPSGVYRTFGAKTADTDYNFIINDDFRSGIAADEKLYIATYDSENDTYYPVMRIDVIK